MKATSEGSQRQIILFIHVSHNKLPFFNRHGAESKEWGPIMVEERGKDGIARIWLK